MTPKTLAGPGSGRSADRREMTSLLGLAVLAGLAILFASSRPWLAVTVRRRPPFGSLPVEITGRSEYPPLTGLAVLALLSAVLVLVTGGLIRRVLGGLLVLVGGGAGGYAGSGLASPSPARLSELLGDRLSQSTGLSELHRHPAWAALTLLAAVLLMACGLLLVARAGRWTAGLSARYSAPAVTAESSDPWRRLDRGDDPTVSDR